MARIGVFICWCGANIAETVDAGEVARYAGTLPGVVVARDYKYMCSDPGQRLITDAIEEHRLSGVVVASCSPRMHETTFRRTAAGVGLNPYMLEMANIREHCSWVHTDRREATEKAQDLVRLMVMKVRRNAPLEEIEVPVTQRVMVIGAGIAGIQAALDVATAGYEVVLVEREPSIGGHMAMLEELGLFVKGTSLCGLGKSAPNPVLSTLKYFREEYETHIRDKKCLSGVCKKIVTFQVNEEKCKKCNVCKKHCPADTIQGEPKKTPYRIIQSGCTQCGICFNSCPFDAIEAA